MFFLLFLLWPDKFVSSLKGKAVGKNANKTVAKLLGYKIVSFIQ